MIYEHLDKQASTLDAALHWGLNEGKVGRVGGGSQRLKGEGGTEV
jgi:hypothetical protein